MVNIKKPYRLLEDNMNVTPHWHTIYKLNSYLFLANPKGF